VVDDEDKDTRAEALLVNVRLQCVALLLVNARLQGSYVHWSPVLSPVADPRHRLDSNVAMSFFHLIGETNNVCQKLITLPSSGSQNSSIFGHQCYP
jgi:hypothetical protein